MEIRENKIAGNLLFVSVNANAKNDFRKAQAERLLAHKAGAFHVAGGLFIKGKRQYLFCKTILMDVVPCRK
jgi:hypothetical protein